MTYSIDKYHAPITLPEIEGNTNSLNKTHFLPCRSLPSRKGDHCWCAPWIIKTPPFTDSWHWERCFRHVISVNPHDNPNRYYYSILQVREPRLRGSELCKDTKPVGLIIDFRNQGCSGWGNGLWSQQTCIWVLIPIGFAMWQMPVSCCFLLCKMGLIMIPTFESCED